MCAMWHPVSGSGVWSIPAGTRSGLGATGDLDLRRVGRPGRAARSTRAARRIGGLGAARRQPADARRHPEAGSSATSISSSAATTHPRSARTSSGPATGTRPRSRGSNRGLSPGGLVALYDGRGRNETRSGCRSSPGLCRRRNGTASCSFGGRRGTRSECSLPCERCSSSRSSTSSSRTASRSRPRRVRTSPRAASLGRGDAPSNGAAAKGESWRP